MAKTTTQKKQRPKSSLLTKVLILALLLGIGWQLMNLQEDVTGAQAEKARLETQLLALRQKNDALAADIAEGNTPSKMEEMARQELGLVYSNERVFYDTSN